MRVPVHQKLRDLGKGVRINENELESKMNPLIAQTNDGKILLRAALNRYVPSDYTQGLKQGFSAPDATWFKGESIDYIRKLLFDKRALLYDFIQPEAVHSLLEEHFDGSRNRRLLIWSLLCFEWWCQLNLARARPASLPGHAHT